jgi:uncharacterized protein
MKSLIASKIAIYLSYRFNMNRRRFVNSWFWGTYDQKEVDYIEEEGGQLTAFEFKFRSSGKNRIPREFLEIYQGTNFTTVSKEKYWDYLSWKLNS